MSTCALPLKLFIISHYVIYNSLIYCSFENDILSMWGVEKPLTECVRADAVLSECLLLT